MLTKLKTISATDNFSYFIRYFAVFTLIFTLMTTIILNLMRSTMYKTSDANFEQVSKTPALIVNFAIAQGALIGYGEEDQSSLPRDNYLGSIATDLHLNTNYHILLYDGKGNLLNQADSLAGLSKVKLNKKKLKEIQDVRLKSAYGEYESYRMMAVKLKPEDLVLPAEVEVRYAAILFNTTQVVESLDAYGNTVIIVMVSFWLISTIASFYLAKISVRPLLLSFQKQKDFVENASHELRTPLAVLQNRLENLFRKPETTIMESRESIASSLEEVRNMKLLTSNLLELARRDDGLKPTMEMIPPNFFNEVLENYQIMAEDSGRNLVAFQQVTQDIRSDKTLLKQVMTILFDNALKYTDPGGFIRIETKVKDRHLLISVADDGIGISGEHKARIFDRFYRVDKARTRQKGGFGLGLSLAKQILDSLKGTISVQDNRPRGSIFTVKIPK